MTREEAIKQVRAVLENLKSNLNGLALEKCTSEAFETLIPELKESEDERIRKKLIEYFNHYKEDREWWEGITPRDIISYLEMQKEQKSLNLSSASEWLRKHVCSYMNSEYNEFHKCVEYDGSIDKERLIKDFEEAMQKEQKPTGATINGEPVPTENQSVDIPLAEWSEEDKEWLSEVYFAIDHSMYSEDERQTMKNYIDSLRKNRKTKFDPKPGDKFLVRCKTEKKDNLWFDKGDERPAHVIQGKDGIMYVVYIDKDGKGNCVSYQDKEKFLDTFEIIKKQW